jgi:hypothetical protein
MSTSSGSQPSPPNRRRTWFVLMAVVVVLALVVCVFVWRTRDGRLANRGTWHNAEDDFSSSMRDQPVPGWRTSATDLGLPAELEGADPSRIAESNDTFGPRPFIGRVGDKAFFLARSGSEPNPQWWLTGVDVKSGQPVFPAVPLLTDINFPRCFINGPTDVLCLSYELSATAWVVDAQSGAVLYNGSTDLRALPGPLVVEQVANHAVASAARQGVYGIGHRAETTWFVPGDGTVVGTADIDTTLATQGSKEKSDWNTAVFDVRDGRVLKPEGQDGIKLQTTVLYPGGFAAVAEVDDKLTGVQFFDETGKHLGGGIQGRPSTDRSGTLPIVARYEGDQSGVFSPGGGLLLDMPPGNKFVVGDSILLNENKSDTFPMWRQYDVNTGAKGAACDFNMGNFLGSDGSVFVFKVSNRKAGLVAKARDRNTCDTLWTLPSAVDSLAHIWRVNDTLVHLSDDGTELTSLVAPS